jgi:hypothetical protein
VSDLGNHMSLFSPKQPSVWDLPGQNGRFHQEVVGESFYAAGFAQVLKGVRIDSKGVELFEKASLVPDPRNKYDRLAVAVVVASQTLGHLPREDAARYQPILFAATSAGRDPQVGARIYARRDADVRGGMLYSVRIDLAPLEVVTAGPLPPGVKAPDGRNAPVHRDHASLTKRTSVDGYLIGVEYDEQTLRVHGKNKVAQIALAGAAYNAGDVVILRPAIAGVRFKAASPLVNGKLVVTTTDGHVYQLHFRRKQQADFERLANELVT